MNERKLTDLMKENDFLYAILVEKESGCYREYGERSRLDHDGIVDSYISKDPTGVFDFLDGKILPQLVSQDRVVGLLSKPHPEYAIALFSHRNDDAIARYRWSSAVDKKITAIWNSNEQPS